MGFGGLFPFEREVFSLKGNGKLISITQKGSVRTLKCNGFIYSRIDKNSVYTHEYWDFFMPLAFIAREPKIAMIGLGGGTIAFQFLSLPGRPSMDILETDKEMAEACRIFVGSRQEGSLNIIMEDGSAYIRKRNLALDLIILDAYGPDGKIPEQFCGKQFVSEAYAALKDKGVLAVNCIGSMLGPSLDSLVQNLSERFEVYRVDTAGYTANIVLVCTKNIGREELVSKSTEGIRALKKSEFLVNAYSNIKRVFISV